MSYGLSEILITVETLYIAFKIGKCCTSNQNRRIKNSIKKYYKIYTILAAAISE